MSIIFLNTRETLIAVVSDDGKTFFILYMTHNNLVSKQILQKKTFKRVTYSIYTESLFYSLAIFSNERKK